LINLNYNIDDSSIVLNGNLEAIIGNRRIRNILSSQFKAVIDSDAIAIHCTNDTFNNELNELLELLDSFGIDFEYEQNAADEIKRFKKDEEKFKIFSLRAKSIRDSKLTEEDKINFENYIESLESLLPNRTLYEKQYLSSYHLTFSQNSCNFSVPGAGKTSIVYATYAYLKSLEPDDIKKVDKLMVFGPLSSFGPWENEYQEIFNRKADSFRLSGIHTLQEKRNHLNSYKPSEISLCSYGSLIGLGEEIKNFLQRFKVMVVLDEAHYIKNTQGGIIARSALEIAEYAASRVILTGTPAPNGYEDLANLFEFIWPGKKVIGYGHNQLRNMTNKRSIIGTVEKLTKNISPFFMRIRKEHLNLKPAIEHEPIAVSMGPIQKKIYNHIERLVIRDLENSDSSFSSELKKARFIRLRQAATNPTLINKKIDEFYYEGPDPGSFVDDKEIMDLIINYNELEVPEKFKKVVSLVQQIISNGEKVVVWFTFIHNIHAFSAALKNLNINNQIIYGAIPTGGDEDDKDELTREKIIAEFTEDNSSFNVLIANTASIAESISLHKACNNAIYVERDFNAGRFAQSKDRIHRYGMDPSKIANYYYILSDCGIDWSIHNRLEEKLERMKVIMEKDEIPLFNFIDDDEIGDDLKSLLKDYVKAN
jgi:hypothetical protein